MYIYNSMLNSNKKCDTRYYNTISVLGIILPDIIKNTIF